MHLTAPRALGDDIPVGLEVRRRRVRGAGHGRGLETIRRPAAPEEFLADALLGVRHRQRRRSAWGPRRITLRGLREPRSSPSDTSHGEVHSGMFGARAPDAVAASESKPCRHPSDPETGARPASTRLDCDGTWEGVGYDERTVPSFDAGVLDGATDRNWQRRGPALGPARRHRRYRLPAGGVLGFRATPQHGPGSACACRHDRRRRSPRPLTAHLTDVASPVRGSRWSRKAPGPRLRARSPTARRRRASRSDARAAYGKPLAYLAARRPRSQ